MKKSQHPISDNFQFSDIFSFSNGYIVLSRDFKSWPLIQDEKAWQLFSFLLMIANFTISQQGTILVKRGEIITNYAYLCKILDKTPDQIRYGLKKLKSINEVSYRRAQNRIHIFLTNYDKYQAVADKSTKEIPTPLPQVSTDNACALPTSKETEKQNNSKTQPCIFNQGNVAVDNFSRSGKDDLQGISSIMQTMLNNGHPTLNMVQKYCTEKGLLVDPDVFYNYYNARDWIGKDGTALKSWRKAIYNWHVRARDKEMAK